MSDQNGLLTPSNLFPRQNTVTKKMVARTLLSTAIASLLYAATSVAVETELDTVTVTASRFETPLREIGASFTVIDREEIENRGYQTITDLLRTQVGLSASVSGGEGSASSLRVRGEEGFRTLILIDGVDVSDPTGTQAGPAIEHLLATGEVERIEILRGPQGFIYGADAGGVIQIFTKEPSEEVEGLVATEYGRYDSSTVNGYVSAGSELGGLFLSVNRRDTNGFNRRLDDETDEADGYENQTFHGKYVWDLTSGMAAQIVYRNTEADTEFDNCFGADGREDNCLGNFNQQIAKFSFSHDGRDFQQSVALSWSETDREFFTVDESSFATDGESTKAEYLFKAQINSWVAVQAGGDIKEEVVDLSSGDRLEIDEYGLFVEAQASFNQSTTLTFGARYDDHDLAGEHVSARLTAAKIIELNRFDQLKFRASAGNGFRAPSASELTFENSPFASPLAAEVKLTEEQTRGFDIGLDFYAGNGAMFGVTYFDQEVTDSIDYNNVTDNSGGFYSNVKGDSFSKGVELEGEIPVADNLVLFSNLTYNETERPDGEQRIRRPENVANFGATFTAMQEKLSMLVNLRIVRDFIDAVFDPVSFAVLDVPLDNYKVIDISARYQWLPNVELTGRIENLGDEDYQEINGFETAGQGVYAGINVSL